jgi:hypothetical protein
VVVVPRSLDSSSAIHDVATLPASIDLCGREWLKDDLGRVLTLAAIRARDGIDPVVVDTGPFAACPAGPCTQVAHGPCDTVVYVRVGEDAYVDYALQGGP